MGQGKKQWSQREEGKVRGMARRPTHSVWRKRWLQLGLAKGNLRKQTWCDCNSSFQRQVRDLGLSALEPSSSHWGCGVRLRSWDPTAAVRDGLQSEKRASGRADLKSSKSCLTFLDPIALALMGSHCWPVQHMSHCIELLIYRVKLKLKEITHASRLLSYPQSFTYCETLKLSKYNLII